MRATGASSARPMMASRSCNTSRAGSQPAAHLPARAPTAAAAGAQAALPGSAMRPAGKPQRSVAAAAASAEPRTQAATPEQGLAIIDIDPNLAAHEEHLRYRWNQYTSTLASIEQNEGSLANFAKGCDRYGIVHEKGKLVYREWAPGAAEAQIIGDFNGWQPTPMERDDFGTWSVKLDEGAIPHGSRVKIRMRHPGGWWVDRIPAWIKWATVPQGVMGAKYDGIHWDPPPYERHVWRNLRPRRPASLRIYEAHVGMSSEEDTVATYTYFKDNVLPRIKALGYNAIQLMAVQEHAYYGSFGYHVTNPFAVSSRSGTPEELKALIDEAHGMGISVLLDVVHSHISSNADDGLAGFDLGQPEEANYFKQGEAGYHSQWDSKLLNYRNYETLRYLLSNLRYWLEEMQFDGFRFDGVTSMLYHHHGINYGFSGGYHEYFSPATNVDAVVYLMLANQLIREINPEAITIAEDVSGMPALCRPVSEGGVGFDYRLGMGLPDYWIELLKHVKDEDWKMSALVGRLCDRRYTEKTIGYCESHDQALVGDQTVAFRLMGAEMYTGMSALQEPTEVIQRGMALHKMIRAVTMALGGEGYLNFMGNEFGHPEWLDFPREGNDWSYHYCRRQWTLVDTDHLRFKFLNAWDAACLALDDRHPYISSTWQWATMIDDEKQVIVAERGPLVWVFNFSPHSDYEGLQARRLAGAGAGDPGAASPGKYRVILDSDAWDFGGAGRVGHDVDHFSAPAGTEEEPDKTYYSRGQFIYVLSPSRTVVAYKKVEEGPGAPPAGPPPAVQAISAAGRRS
ncbi:hypothetical protein CHLNCDRAFT_33566 [Chlorella variabilis]|uniref:1,4-alpha-glucan branching enzyme n=1 Tax=Chlorella variabilis TaxID=554065 RepID=E1Z2X5_CHLVA|nr:hypothetical protein CHLNCDRAFT_33566 [Chlorella variabilis]EFN60069.1 hypothetical protein CHLNCDRAFT_33566 [Chlorella variabilis]|eukprot:XP_005852171.1 hypothetical protein CHLNCDRAFT_33566 [Chlorella variabilis]